MDNGKHWNLPPERHLIEDLQDRDYRRGFVEGHTTDSIAFQLRAMRRAEGWEQKDVAERLGNAKLQPMISRYENPDYGKYSISTLLELANVFDVALAVRFVPFSELVAWDASANPEKDCPTPFSRDTKLEEIADGSIRMIALAGKQRTEEMRKRISELWLMFLTLVTGHPPGELQKKPEPPDPKEQP
jgi:transcriptional regulator with XRE-family HTH domain